jgi:hypothetical protein
VNRTLARILNRLLLRFGAFDFRVAEYPMANGGPTLRKGHHYKYKSLDGSPIGHVIEILRDNKLYFPRPSQLNDPDEGKPELVIGDISDPAYWPAVEAWVRRCVTHRTTPAPEAQIQAELRQLTQAKLEAMASESAEAYKAAVEERYRIFSLAGSALNRHLWENYAGSFNGVCIEFDVDSHFGTLFAVTYSDEPRRVDLTRINDFEHLRLTALVKGTRWSEEKEARMIFGEPPIDDQPVLVNQRYAFPPDRLTGLLIGYKVSRAQREELLAIARARAHPVRCYLVRPIPWGQRVWPRRIR